MSSQSAPSSPVVRDDEKGDVLDKTKWLENVFKKSPGSSTTVSNSNPPTPSSPGVLVEDRHKWIQDTLLTKHEGIEYRDPNMPAVESDGLSLPHFEESAVGLEVAASQGSNSVSNDSEPIAGVSSSDGATEIQNRPKMSVDKFVEKESASPTVEDCLHKDKNVSETEGQVELMRNAAMIGEIRNIPGSVIVALTSTCEGRSSTLQSPVSDARAVVAQSVPVSAEGTEAMELADAVECVSASGQNADVGNNCSTGKQTPPPVRSRELPDLSFGIPKDEISVEQEDCIQTEASSPERPNVDVHVVDTADTESVEIVDAEIREVPATGESTSTACEATDSVAANFRQPASECHEGTPPLDGDRTNREKTKIIEVPTYSEACIDIAEVVFQGEQDEQTLSPVVITDGARTMAVNGSFEIEELDDSQDCARSFSRNESPCNDTSSSDEGCVPIAKTSSKTPDGAVVQQTTETFGVGERVSSGPDPSCFDTEETTIDASAPYYEKSGFEPLRQPIEEVVLSKSRTIADAGTKPQASTNRNVEETSIEPLVASNTVRSLAETSQREVEAETVALGTETENFCAPNSNNGDSQNEYSAVADDKGKYTDPITTDIGIAASIRAVSDVIVTPGGDFAPKVTAPAGTIVEDKAANLDSSRVEEESGKVDVDMSVANSNKEGVGVLQIDAGCETMSAEENEDDFVEHLPAAIGQQSDDGPVIIGSDVDVGSTALSNTATKTLTGSELSPTHGVKERESSLVTSEQEGDVGSTVVSKEVVEDIVDRGIATNLAANDNAESDNKGQTASDTNSRPEHEQLVDAVITPRHGGPMAMELDHDSVDPVTSIQREAGELKDESDNHVEEGESNEEVVGLPLNVVEQTEAKTRIVEVPTFTEACIDIADVVLPSGQEVPFPVIITDGENTMAVNGSFEIEDVSVSKCCPPSVKLARPDCVATEIDATPEVSRCSIYGHDSLEHESDVERPKVTKKLHFSCDEQGATRQVSSGTLYGKDSTAVCLQGTQKVSELTSPVFIGNLETPHKSAEGDDAIAFVGDFETPNVGEQSVGNDDDEEEEAQFVGEFETPHRTEQVLQMVPAPPLPFVDTVSEEGALAQVTTEDTITASNQTFVEPLTEPQRFKVKNISTTFSSDSSSFGLTRLTPDVTIPVSPGGSSVFSMRDDTGVNQHRVDATKLDFLHTRKGKAFVEHARRNAEKFREVRSTMPESWRHSPHEIQRNLPRVEALLDGKASYILDKSDNEATESSVGNTALSPAKPFVEDDDVGTVSCLESCTIM